MISNVTNVNSWPLIKSTIVKQGYLLQMIDDFKDCFGDPDITGKVGTDIEEGKCCWNVVTALQYCTEDQKKTLSQCYGKPSEESVNTVKHIYSELNLKDIFDREVDRLEEEINSYIETIGQSDDKMFVKVLEYLMKMIKKQKILTNVCEYMKEFSADIDYYCY